MAVHEILLLGNPILYERCEEIRRHELDAMMPVADGLRDTLRAFRHKHGFGRAIAAPQIGVTKRIICMHVEKPAIIINPVISLVGDETFVLWDDCMSFPDILVKVRRHKRIRMTYKDMDWNDCTIDAEDSLSELLQHECDHLDGILAIQRAIDGRSIALASQRKLLSI